MYNYEFEKNSFMQNIKEIENNYENLTKEYETELDKYK